MPCDVSQSAPFRARLARHGAADGTLHPNSPRCRSRHPARSCEPYGAHSRGGCATGRSLCAPLPTPFALLPVVKKRPAGRAVSRVLSRRWPGQPVTVKAIYLDPTLPPGSSPQGRKRPTRGGVNHAIATAWPCTRWGLPCRRPHSRRGALLPHHFTLTGPELLTGARGPAVSFLWHFPYPASPLGATQDGGRYPPPWFNGARTFLPSPQGRGAAFCASGQWHCIMPARCAAFIFGVPRLAGKHSCGYDFAYDTLDCGFLADARLELHKRERMRR